MLFNQSFFFLDSFDGAGLGVEDSAAGLESVFVSVFDSDLDSDFPSDFEEESLDAVDVEGEPVSFFAELV